ncbi:MAG: hypothetical protein AAB263_00310 [Planctomycetota bacterium]
MAISVFGRWWLLQWFIAVILVLSCSRLPAIEAQQVTLTAPLVTVVRAQLDGSNKPPGVSSLDVDVQVPDDAPADLGIGCFCTDNQGHWYQSMHPKPLTPGVHRLRFQLDGHAPLAGEGHRGSWSAYHATLVAKAGVFLWSSTQSRAKLRISMRAHRESTAVSAPYRINDLELAGAIAGKDALTWPTGSCWTLTCRPQPCPDRPFDPEHFSLTLRITDPNGSVVRVHGFFREPMQLIDRGDQEVSKPGDPAHVAVRWWPKIPGRHQLSLEVAWEGKIQVTTQLPDLVATGSTWDDYVRIAENDHRFFSVGGKGDASRWYWPIGISMVMVTDERMLGTVSGREVRRTPDRGFQSYAAYMKRFAAGGADLVQVWMASWSFALEWNERWPGQHGLGHYSPLNAERLDRLLDLAAQLGMRVNIVLYSHGPASTKHSPEWQDHPYNVANGGPMRSPKDVFTNPIMWKAQDNLHRYMRARWGDHPAVFAWEFWSEPQGCDIWPDPTIVVDWHSRAAKLWRELDPNGRLLSTYTGGFEFHFPVEEIRTIPQLDVVVDSAYRPRKKTDTTTVTEEMWNKMHQLPDQFTHYKRPVLISEYGGNFMGDLEKIAIDHRIGAWSALVTGYAGGPMLWWHEWVDQGNRWEPFMAIRQFIRGEDMRGTQVQFLNLAVDSPLGGLWTAVASRPGRMLGYVLDRTWARRGGEPRTHHGGHITLADQARAGAMHLEWWDADTGTRLQEITKQHDGGKLVLDMPDFRCHLAFKLWREDAAAKPAK